MSSIDLDAVLQDCAGLVYISDGTRGSNRVGAALGHVKPLVDEVRWLREQAGEAHNALVMAAAPLLWATDGRLPTGVRHATSYIEKLEADVKRLETERDLALEHDTQPYPTAWAYEKACDENSRLHDEVRALEISNLHLQSELRAALGSSGSAW